jgi:ribonuclease BN (tRNA processing enzyme)
MMKLVLLGAAGFIPTDQAQTACFMLPEPGIIQGAGTGLYRMHRYLQAAELDVYLPHAHGDHTSGLIYLFASFVVQGIRQAEGEVTKIISGEMGIKANNRLHSARIHATQPAVDFLAKEYALYRLDWRLLEPREPLPGGGWITTFSVNNGSDEVGFRLDWPGHSMAYITDTTADPDAGYLDTIRGVDVLLHDCYGPNRLAAMLVAVHHSYPEGVAQIAARAGVGRLILVHKNPIPQWSIHADVETARAVFPAIEIGVDGMEIEF